MSSVNPFSYTVAPVENTTSARKIEFKALKQCHLLFSHMITSDKLAKSAPELVVICADIYPKLF